MIKNHCNFSISVSSVGTRFVLYCYIEQTSEMGRGQGEIIKQGNELYDCLKN